jgi:DNA primase
MIVTPMYDNRGVSVGVIKRSIEGKEFKNSFNLPSTKTLFGIHIAKAQSVDEVVLCESNFDAILSHQSGHPAVATLGATFSDYHLTQLSRYFNKVVIATDNDEGGHKFAERIGRRCKERGLFVYRMQYSQFEMLPDDAKDFGEIAKNYDVLEAREKIAQSIRFAVPMIL